MRKWRALIVGSIRATVLIGLAVKAAGTLPAFAQEMWAAHNAVRPKRGCAARRGKMQVVQDGGDAGAEHRVRFAAGYGKKI